GVCPVESGVSWLAELVIDTFPPDETNQAHPLPNRFTPASLNSARNLAKSPNAALIASPSGPVGSPPAFGAIHCQKAEWLEWPPPLLRTAVRVGSSTGSLARFRIRSSIGRWSRSGYFDRAAFRLST